MLKRAYIFLAPPSPPSQIFFSVLFVINVVSRVQVSYVRNTQKEEEEELNRLTQEVTMLGRLNHPNVVRCLGATQHEGHINVFVEWMAGEWGVI